MADAGLIQTSLIWVTYAAAIALCLAAAVITTFTWQTPRERSAVVSLVAVISLTSLLATVLLLPVDIALVSATGSTSLGAKKGWATPERIDSLLLTLRVLYYVLYSFDALLCLLLIPFAYFWYEEYDEVEFEEEGRSWRSRFWAAARYTSLFLGLVIILFLVGFFVPAAGNGVNSHLDLDFYRDLLARNNFEKALTFALGLLITLGTGLYVLYTGVGLAVLPISLVRASPRITAPQLSANTATQLEQNRERQRQLEMRNVNRDAMSRMDRRELSALAREEQTLVRRERLAAEASGERQSKLYQAWLTVCAMLRPIKMLGGLLLVAASLLVWASMLITGIDKAANSVCKQRCGYILAKISLFQPVNWLFVKTANIFPVDYVIMAALTLYLFSSSISGIATVGVRFLWVRIFQIRRGRTAPQALLIATAMLGLITLAINFALVTFVAPQYALYGTQTICTRKPEAPGAGPNCKGFPELVKPCSEALDHGVLADVCTPSVMSTLLNRITITWPFFGIVDFWGQFVFLLVFLLTFIAAVFRPPKADVTDMDADAEEDEEEALLAATGRRIPSRDTNYGTN